MTNKTEEKCISMLLEKFPSSEYLIDIYDFEIYITRINKEPIVDIEIDGVILGYRPDEETRKVLWKVKDILEEEYAMYLDISSEVLKDEKWSQRLEELRSIKYDY